MPRIEALIQQAVGQFEGAMALEWPGSQLDAARALTDEARVRAYRLYLAGSAMGFERGWMSLYQLLAARPDGRIDGSGPRGAQSVYPFNREHIYGRGGGATSGSSPPS